MQAQPAHQPQFESNLVRFGAFRCHPSYPFFADTGPIRFGHIIVFPRTSVRIIHEGGEPIVASPNVVMFYNAGQIYYREPISDEGDLCEWFAFHPQTIIEALREVNAAIDNPERPFSLTHGPSDAVSYMMQRMVVEHFWANEQPDYLHMEELLLHVLFRVVANALQVRGHQVQTTKTETARARLSLVCSVQELIATQFEQSLNLDAIAAAVHSSPFRLCRLFRQQTGMTIHQFQEQIRLRSALARLPDCRGDLTRLALDLGYSSHSHFTYAFRRTFGTSPSTVAVNPSSSLLHELSKILIVEPPPTSVSSTPIPPVYH